MVRLKEEQDILSSTKLLENNSEIFAGWIFHYQEVSNGVYQFELRDKAGHLAGCTDHDFERGLETCASHAFDIEKWLTPTVNWNRFLFDLYKFKLSKYKLTEVILVEKDFGSWTIQFDKHRVILDGEDCVLISQHQDKKRNWIDRQHIKFINLTFEKIKMMTNLIIEESHISDDITKVEQTWWQKLIGQFTHA